MILFNNPNNTKFVVTNYSNTLDDYKNFEEFVCPNYYYGKEKKKINLYFSPYSTILNCAVLLKKKEKRMHVTPDPSY